MIPVRDHNPTAGPVVVVWGIVLTCIAAFVLPWLEGGEQQILTVAYRWGLTPAAWWADPIAAAPTVVTSAFLHGGWAHLIGNLVFLWVFGDNVEDAMGHARFLLFYLLGALAAVLAHAALTDDPTIPLIGASGAISAVLGAYLRIYPRKMLQAIVLPLIVPWLVLRPIFRVRPFFLWTLPAWVFLGYWAVLQVWEGFGAVGDGVAWWAHVGGFLFGLVFAPALAQRRRRGRERMGVS